jgi:hypothetical protein
MSQLYVPTMDAQDTHTYSGSLYEAPTLNVLGTVGDLTESGIIGKKLGAPDYMFQIPAPIANASA